MTTRFEKIGKMSLDETAQFINDATEFVAWCSSSEEDICNGEHCLQCIKHWLNETLVDDDILCEEPHGSYECFHCLSKSVIWDVDFSFSDMGYEGEGIVHCCHCSNCGAQIEYWIDFDSDSST